MENVNNRIRILRKDKKISQKKFAESINLSQNHVCSLEKGLRNITNRTIDDICRVYKVNKDWLINGNGEMYINELDELKIEDDEIKDFMRMYLKLDIESKAHIMGLVKKQIELQNSMEKKH